jgi:hypothetical protein
VCVCAFPPIVARQRLGKNLLIVAMQLLGRNVTEVTNTHATIKELLDESFSMWPELLVLFSTSSRPAVEPTQPPIRKVPGAPSTGVKRPGRKADHSAPSSAELKNGGDIPPLHHASSWRGA